jgi:hypothetical protein
MLPVFVRMNLDCRQIPAAVEAEWNMLPGRMEKPYFFEGDPGKYIQGFPGGSLVQTQASSARV